MNEYTSELMVYYEFIDGVADGDFDRKWKGLDESNESLNKQNLTGALLSMRDEMAAA